MGLLQKLPRYNSCCCCIDLRSGAIILGVLSVIGASSSLMKAIIYLIYPEAFIREYKIGEDKEITNSEENIISCILVAVLISSSVILFTELLLLIGALKRNVRMLALYLRLKLFWVGILMVLTSIVVVVLLFVEPVMVILVLIGAGVGFAISLYYLFCINSYYLLLEDEQQRISGTAYQFKV